MMKSAFRPETANSLGRSLPVYEKKESREHVLQQSSKHANGTRTATVGGTAQRTRTHTASERNNMTCDTSIADSASAGSKQYFGSTVSAGSHKKHELAEVTRSTQSGSDARSSSRTQKRSNIHAASTCRDIRPAGVHKASSGTEGNTAASHRRSKVPSTKNPPPSSATSSSSSLLSATSRRSSSQILADSLKASKTAPSRLYPSLPLLHEDDIVQHRRGQRSLSEGAGVDQSSTAADEDANTSFASRRSTSHSAVMALAKEYELIDGREEEEVYNEHVETNLASDSDRALDGGDDETIQATGNSSNRAFALRGSEQPRPKSTCATHGHSATRKAIRVAEIQDNIEIMDKEIEATMRKFYELQEKRKVLVAELTAASRENGAGVPVIPEEVSFNQSGSNRQKSSTCKEQGSSSSRLTRPTKKDISSWIEKEATHSNPTLAMLSEGSGDDELVQNQVQPRVA